jgi:glycerol uptake facilitator-like aquaporin
VAAAWRLGNLGATTPNPVMSHWQAFLMEFMVVCIFIFVVLGSGVDPISKSAKLVLSIYHNLSLLFSLSL